MRRAAPPVQAAAPFRLSFNAFLPAAAVSPGRRHRVRLPARASGNTCDLRQGLANVALVQIGFLRLVRFE